MSPSSIPLDAAEYWHPEQRGIFHKLSMNLMPGMLVIYSRKPYRVLDTRARPLDLWPEDYRERWVAAGMPEPATWSGRPIIVVLGPEGHPNAKPTHLLTSCMYMWKSLPEHYWVCRLCGELPPCGQVHNEHVMLAAASRLEKDLAIMPGYCHGCASPVTARQKAITFEGENLIRPDFGDGSAIFHARRACHDAAARYDALWAKAAPGRRKKLSCEGRARYHYDGTMDCTEGAQCPGRVGHDSAEWHHPGAGRLTAGCWCVSGDLPERIARQMREGDAP